MLTTSTQCCCTVTTGNKNVKSLWDDSIFSTGGSNVVAVATAWQPAGPGISRNPSTQYTCGLAASTVSRRGAKQNGKE